MSGSDGMSSQEATVVIEKMLKMQEKIEVLEKMIEELKLGNQKERAARRNGGGG